MTESTLHRTAGRDLRLHRGDFSTAVDGYRMPTISWRLQIDAADCECCGTEIHGPVTVHWIHGLHDADVDDLLKIEGRDTVRVVNSVKETGDSTE